MRQSGVSTPERSRRAREWIDFGVDGSWERAAPRREHASAPHGQAQAEARAHGQALPIVRAPEPIGATNAVVRAPRAAAVSARTPRPEIETSTEWSHASAMSTPAPRPGAGVPGRRTVTIRGRGAERDLAFSPQRTARRPATRAHERPGFKPDRAALWAIMLGVFLVLVAATSSHAATLRHAAGAHHSALSRPATALVSVRAAPYRR